jgi:hypothetical protein
MLKGDLKIKTIRYEKHENLNGLEKKSRKLTAKN